MIRRIDLTLRNLHIHDIGSSENGSDYAVMAAYGAQVHFINVTLGSGQKTTIRAFGKGKTPDIFFRVVVVSIVDLFVRQLIHSLLSSMLSRKVTGCSFIKEASSLYFFL